MTSPEARFSSTFGKELKRRGLLAFRMESSHTFPGLPDWCIVTQYRVHFIELKSEKGRLTPAQVVTHNLFKLAGQQIRVLRQLKNSVTIDDTEEYSTLKEAVDKLLEATNEYRTSK